MPVHAPELLPDREKMGPSRSAAALQTRIGGAGCKRLMGIRRLGSNLFLVTP
jgi:hypothetical protein